MKLFGQYKDLQEILSPVTTAYQDTPPQVLSDSHTNGQREAGLPFHSQWQTVEGNIHRLRKPEEMQTIAAHSLFAAGQLFISLVLQAVRLLSFTHPYCNKTPGKGMQWKARNYLFFSFCQNFCQSAKGLSKDAVL